MPNRKNADDLFAQGIASGQLVRDAAHAAGISLATASRRLADPAFKEKIAEIRRNFLERTTARLAARTTRAVDRLEGLVQSKDERVSLAAIKLTLDAANELFQLADLQRQIDELKAERERRSGYPIPINPPKD